MNDLIRHSGGELIKLIKGEHDVGKPFQHDILLLTIQVAGTSYLNNIREIEPSLDEQTRVRFFREPDNPYDRRAIVIRTDAGQKIGYVPRAKNEILSNLMDGGKLLYGIIRQKEWQDSWLRIVLNVYLNE